MRGVDTHMLKPQVKRSKGVRKSVINFNIIRSFCERGACPTNLMAIEDTW